MENSPQLADASPPTRSALVRIGTIRRRWKKQRETTSRTNPEPGVRGWKEHSGGATKAQPPACRWSVKFEAEARTRTLESILPQEQRNETGYRCAAPELA